jgi:RNA polymerase sigma factor (sigma-70 family)
MAATTLPTFLNRLKQAMAGEALAACSDRELVERLRAGRDDAAFRAVLERHGPMVFQVCRRALNSTADVEDAFQATFLVLVRRGHTIRRHTSLASWLHGVARRTALKLRTQASRRRRRETRSARPASVGLADDTTWGELRGLLDEELERLPEACRTALVLCYLEGRTQDEAAAQLDVSKSTLRRHLERARGMLGRRLARRGITLGAALAARLLTDCSPSAAMPRVLLARTTESARHTAANVAAPASVLPARVAALSDGVMKTMQYAKYKTIVAVLTCGLVLGFGVNQFGPRLASAQDAKPAADVRRPATNPDIEPIDPTLLFEADVQKELRLSENQIGQLADAWNKGTEAASIQTKRVAEIDERIKKLQAEIERLDRERGNAHQAIHQSQTEHVRAAIPSVLSRDATSQLRQMTLQRMQLSDVLRDAKVRARLNLNDEQVKKIQEITEKGSEGHYRVALATQEARVRYTQALTTVRGLYLHRATLSDASRGELLKVLTPAQREALERLSGMKLDGK